MKPNNRIIRGYYIHKTIRTAYFGRISLIIWDTLPTKYLNQCLDNGEIPDWDFIMEGTGETAPLPVHERYRRYVLGYLLEDGYIQGHIESQYTSGLSPHSQDSISDSQALPRVQALHNPPSRIQRDIVDIQCFLQDQCMETGSIQEIVFDKKTGGYLMQTKQNYCLNEKAVLVVCRILLESRVLVKTELFPIIHSLAALLSASLCSSSLLL